jgi:ATP-dependent Lon protease
MTKDTIVKNCAKKDTLSKKSKKREEMNRRRKANENSDDDCDSFIESDEEEEEMDTQEYRKFISKIFPSKYISKKIGDGKKLKKLLDDVSNENESEEEEDSEESDASSEEEKPKKKLSTSKSKTNLKKFKPSKKPMKKQVKKSKKVVKEDSESEDIEESEEDDEDDEEESEDEEEGEEYEISGGKNSGKFNIIFTIGGQGSEEEEEWEDYDSEEDEDYDSQEETENEDESVSSDSSSDDDEEDEDDDEEEEEEEEEVVTKKSKKYATRSAAKKSTKSKEEEKKYKTSEASYKNQEITVTAKDENEKESDYDDVLKQLRDLQGKHKNNKAISECIETYEKKVKENKKKAEKKQKKQKDKNSRIFKRVLRDKNKNNDFEFFEKLEIDEQKKIIKEVREINKISRIEKPYRMTLLESDIPAIFKASAMKKISNLRYMEPGSGEYYKVKNWVDTFMQIPFGKYNTLPVNISDGVEKCHEFMENAQKTLDSAVYGLNDAKMQIMQMLGQLVTNPQAIGTAIAIKGPMGTGKTSLVKEGISKILNRPFSFIALGGATDSSFLEGHSYTYEGSVWGKIVQIIIDSKCMNPVIYFDELDKISDTPKGEEIAGILTHLTDTSQNSQFHDKYFAEIDFDLSKCLFIFSYNDESKVNPILRDRMYKIQTKGYDKKEKTIIGNNYLLPKIREQVKFSSEDIVIPDQAIHHIIEEYCMKEDGVRNLKRCLEIIYTKLNLYRLMKPGTNLFEQEMSLKVEFPMTVTNDIVDKLIKKDKEALNKSLYGLYV